MLFRSGAILVVTTGSVAWVESDDSCGAAGRTHSTGPVVCENNSDMFSEGSCGSLGTVDWLDKDAAMVNGAGFGRSCGWISLETVSVGSVICVDNAAAAKGTPANALVTSGSFGSVFCSVMDETSNDAGTGS